MKKKKTRPAMSWYYYISLTIDSGTPNSPNQSSTPLNPVVAKRALVQCTVIIIRSSIDPFTLVTNLYSREIIPKDVYKRVKDRDTRDSAEDRCDKILDYLTDRIEHDINIFTSFLSVLRELDRDDLADIIMTKYFRLVPFVLTNWINSNLSFSELNTAESRK